MNKEEKKRLKADLEAYCNDTIDKNGERGKDWAFGAVVFSILIGLDRKEAEELLGKYELVNPIALEMWEGKDDPEKDVHA